MRRGRHEGNVFKRPTRSYWEGSIRLAGRRYYVTGRSRQEVVERLRALSARHGLSGLALPTRLTVGEWLARWLEAGRSRWRPSTWQRRERLLRFLLPLLGHLSLSRLSPLQVMAALEELRGKGMGACSLLLSYDTLHAALEEAVTLGLIPDNPCQRVPRPRYSPRPRPVWGEEEARRFYRVCLESGHPLGPLLAFLLSTGLRVGEALGLRWQDVGEDGALWVRETAVWLPHSREFHLGPPKTRAGQRALVLSRAALRCLELVGPPASPEARIFWPTGDRPPTPQQLHRAMTALCREAGVPRLNVHSLRSVAASLLVARGMELRAIQALLGHSRPSITLDVYSRHVAPQARLVAKALNQAFGEEETEA